MFVFQTKRNFYYLTVLVAAVVLLMVILWGRSSGQNRAVAESTVTTVDEITVALDYFYQDQGRYPSAVEFEDQNVMGIYFSKFPVIFTPTKQCPEPLVYKRPKTGFYQLNFCLPKSSGAFQKGWNSYSQEK